MERPAILNRSMPRTPDAVIGFPAPRTTNVSVPKTKIYEANLHTFKGLQKKYSRCRAECEGQMNTIFEDSVDFRSCGPQLFNHTVKLPANSPKDTYMSRRAGLRHVLLVDAIPTLQSLDLRQSDGIRKLRKCHHLSGKWCWCFSALEYFQQAQHSMCGCKEHTDREDNQLEAE